MILVKFWKVNFCTPIWSSASLKCGKGDQMWFQFDWSYCFGPLLKQLWWVLWSWREQSFLVCPVFWKHKFDHCKKDFFCIQAHHQTIHPKGGSSSLLTSFNSFLVCTSHAPFLRIDNLAIFNFSPSRVLRASVHTWVCVLLSRKKSILSKRALSPNHIDQVDLFWSYLSLMMFCPKPERCHRFLMLFIVHTGLLNKLKLQTLDALSATAQVELPLSSSFWNQPSFKQRRHTQLYKKNLKMFQYSQLSLYSTDFNSVLFNIAWNLTNEKCILCW